MSGGEPLVDGGDFRSHEVGNETGLLVIALRALPSGPERLADIGPSGIRIDRRDADIVIYRDEADENWKEASRSSSPSIVMRPVALRFFERTALCETAEALSGGRTCTQLGLSGTAAIGKAHA